MDRPSRALGATLALSVAVLPAAAMAETKTLAGRPGTDSTKWDVFYSGAAGASSITGSGEDDVIFGDPAAASGGPTAMKRLVMGRDANGNPVEPDAGIYIAGMGSGLVSPDGAWVLVSSAATNLVPGVAMNGFIQIYAVNLWDGRIVPISVAADGTTFGNNDSEYARFSPDGASVAFVTKATNLADGPASEVLMKDLGTGAVRRMSGRRGTGEAVGGFVAQSLSFSPDGKFLSFVTSNDLTPESGPQPDDNAVRDVYMVANSGNAADAATATLLSTKEDGSSQMPASISGVFSPRGDGLFLTSSANLFSSQTDTNAGSDIYFKRFSQSNTAQERMHGPVSMLSLQSGEQGTNCDSDASAPHPDGARIAFVTDCVFQLGDMLNTGDVYFTDSDMTGAEKKVTGLLLAISAKGTEFGNDVSYDPAVSPDGNRIAFASWATNLAEGSAGNHSRILLRDIPAGSIPHLISRKPGNADGDASVGFHAFTPDGAAIVFDSAATNLVSAPTTMPNVYLASLPAAASTGADVIDGGAGIDRIFGGGGNDTIDGGAGADWMFGGTGDDLFKVDDAGDRVIEKPGEGRDRVIARLDYILPDNVENLTLAGTAKTGTGNAGNNVLVGSAAANVFSGGAGNDRLEGRGGKDRLTGGPGVDSFVFRKATESRPGKTRRDTVTDFDAAAGETIDLSRMDANRSRKGVQRFRYIGARAFSGTPGELRFSRGLLRGDVDGDARTDFEVAVKVVAGKLRKSNLKLK